MAPKRKGKGKKTEKKAQPTNTAPPVGSLSPAPTTFEALGEQYTLAKNTAKDIKAVCSTLRYVNEKGDVPFYRKDALPLLTTRLTDHYGSEEVYAQELANATNLGLSVEGTGFELRRRRYFHEREHGAANDGNQDENEIANAGDPSRGIGDAQVLLFLRERGLNIDGTDCDRRFRLLRHELEYMKAHCPGGKYWESLFFRAETTEEAITDVTRQRAETRKEEAKQTKLDRAKDRQTYAELPHRKQLDIPYRQSFQNEVRGTGHFAQQNVRGDGNCLFRAFAVLWYGKESYHETIREDVQRFWRAVMEGDENTPPVDLRRQFYMDLLIDSTEPGAVPGDPVNSDLATQIANPGYWASQHMFPDVYDITVIVHVPRLRAGIVDRWVHVARGASTNRPQRQFHFAHYGNHFTALRMMTETGGKRSTREFVPPSLTDYRFELHRVENSDIGAFNTQLGSRAENPDDLLYLEEHERVDLDRGEPYWRAEYPFVDEGEDGNGPGNPPDNDGNGKNPDGEGEERDHHNSPDGKGEEGDYHNGPDEDGANENQTRKRKTLREDGPPRKRQALNPTDNQGGNHNNPGEDGANMNQNNKRKPSKEDGPPPKRRTFNLANHELEDPFNPPRLQGPTNHDIGFMNQIYRRKVAEVAYIEGQLERGIFHTPVTAPYGRNILKKTRNFIRYQNEDEIPKHVTPPNPFELPDPERTIDRRNLFSRESHDNRAIRNEERRASLDDGSYTPPPQRPQADFTQPPLIKEARRRVRTLNQLSPTTEARYRRSWRRVYGVPNYINGIPISSSTARTGRPIPGYISRREYLQDQVKKRFAIQVDSSVSSSDYSLSPT
ncbi:hypothetical protein EJ08DRAFT_721264 [Tothia fuscella]|uniref:OTU domain-containing protein n=1 Tax=Tothia fuscella TaxID=1048955 RepID=A0A9P4TVX5_9PEZI|nr:hypothetical protein EJ08DRAFT_721264 [Tothia fuscella]